MNSFGSTLMTTGLIIASLVWGGINLRTITIEQPLLRASVSTSSSRSISSLPPESVSEPVPLVRTVRYEIESPGHSSQGEIDSSGQHAGEITTRISQRHHVTFDYRVTDFGWVVTDLAGQKQDPINGHYWFYFVNGDLAPKRLDRTYLKPGDTLVWKYLPLF